jgi:hypothetical protein
MATIFSNAFKNAVIDSLLGRATVPASARMTYISYYTGAQAADPLTAPAGVFVNTSISQNATLLSNLTQPSGGIVQTLSPIQPSANPNNAGIVTTARIYGADASTPIMDTTASLAGGGGGSRFVTDFFSVKLPGSLGTLSFNDALRDALLSSFTITSTNVAALTSASVKVYSGTPPANANAPATGTLLWTGTTAAGGASWNASSGGSSALASNIAAVAAASGTGGYVRIEKGIYVLQGSIGTSGTDFVFDSITMTSGQTYSLTNATITM